MAPTSGRSIGRPRGPAERHLEYAGGKNPVTSRVRQVRDSRTAPGVRGSGSPERGDPSNKPGKPSVRVVVVSDLHFGKESERTGDWTPWAEEVVKKTEELTRPEDIFLFVGDLAKRGRPPHKVGEHFLRGLDALSRIPAKTKLFVLGDKDLECLTRRSIFDRVGGRKDLDHIIPDPAKPDRIYLDKFYPETAAFLLERGGVPPP